MSYILLQGDAVHLPLPDRSVDLVFGSPPYIDARTYGIKAQRLCQEWIDWMLVVTTESCRVSKGLVLWVCASGVRNYCYQPAPEGLLYEWWRRGGQCWRPAYWYRSGIPGSGGQHWLRADIEYVYAFLGPDRRPQRGRPATHSKWKDYGAYASVQSGVGGRTRTIDKVPVNRTDHGEPAPNDPTAFWVNNTAMGQPPKYEPGGNFSQRQENGKRANDPYDKPVLANPGNLIETEPEDDGVWTDNTVMGHEPKNHNGASNFTCYDDNGLKDIAFRNPPPLANPGNLIETETEEEGVWTDNTAMGHPPDRDKYSGGRHKTRNGFTQGSCHVPDIVNPGNLIKTGSGYGSLGSPHAHDNEAPFPEALAEFFIKTACKPGGLVLDPFSGSGTTVAVAERLGRHGIGLDIRRSQAELAERRITRPHLERKRTGRPEKNMPLFS